MCQASLGLVEVQMGAHDFKLNKVPFSALKSVNINVSRSAAPKLALVPASSEYQCFPQCCPETSSFVGKPLIL